jgi:hypothetical protein
MGNLCSIKIFDTNSLPSSNETNETNEANKTNEVNKTNETKELKLPTHNNNNKCERSSTYHESKYILSFRTDEEEELSNLKDKFKNK